MGHLGVSSRQVMGRFAARPSQVSTKDRSLESGYSWPVPGLRSDIVDDSTE